MTDVTMDELDVAGGMIIGSLPGGMTGWGTRIMKTHERPSKPLYSRP